VPAAAAGEALALALAVGGAEAAAEA